MGKKLACFYMSKVMMILATFPFRDMRIKMPSFAVMRAAFFMFPACCLVASRQITQFAKPIIS
jgi:hypothetical protein